MKARFPNLIATLCLAATGAAAHDPSGADAFHDWFVAQRQPSGAPCCGALDTHGGDAHYVDVRMDGAGRYLVRVGTHWTPYPGRVDPDIINPTGRNVAWYDGTWPDIFWYCLRLSGGS